MPSISTLRTCSVRGMIVFVLVLCGLKNGSAQVPIVIGTPIQSYQDSYFEYFGVGFGGSYMGPGGGFFFNNGGGLPAVPFGIPFSGAHLGAAGRVGNWNYHWNLYAGQGSRRSIVQQTPMLTVTNGYPGYFFSGQLTPFVTSVFPVVYDRPISPLALRLDELRAQGKSPADLVPESNEKDALDSNPTSERVLPPLPQEDDPPLRLGRPERK